MVSRLWERLFEAKWAGGWAAFRWTFLLAALLTHGPRVADLSDAYAASDLILSRGPLHLGEYWILTPGSALLVWLVGVLGLGLLAWGGRLARPGVVVFLVGYWLLMSAEAANIKAYDRLLTFQALALLVGPTHERGLTHKWRTPSGRHVLLVVYGFLYGSTGVLKALEPDGTWWDGSALAYNMVDAQYGGMTLGIWLSGMPSVMAALGWLTVLFEAGFPLLVLLRRSNPWILLVGVGFHLGILLTMQVGTFPLVAIAAYPALLQPAAAQRLWCALAAPFSSAS